MNKNRLEAFTDGVMAIVITIMVLEFEIPKDPTIHSYMEMWPEFISYAISFLFVGLNWATHHHLFQTISKINNKVLWANMASLFVLSFVPFATAAMGENNFKEITVTIYASILTLSVLCYFLLVHQLRLLYGKESKFYASFKGQKKSYISLGLNILSVIISAVGFPKIAFMLLIITSLAWFLPNHMFEHKIE